LVHLKADISSFLYIYAKYTNNNSDVNTPSVQLGKFKCFYAQNKIETTLIVVNFNYINQRYISWQTIRLQECI